MASGDFTYNTPSFFNSEEWNNEASEFLWDSPQPEPMSNLDNGGDQIMDQPDMEPIKAEAQEQTGVASGSHKRNGKQKQKVSGSGATQPMFSMQSSASESSSHSSSSRSSRRKRKASSESSPPALFGAVAAASVDEQLPGTFKMDRMFGDIDDTYQFEDSTFPTMGVGMDNLSLDSMGGLMSNPQFDITSAMDTPEALGMFTDSKSEGFSPQNFGSLRTHQSMNNSPQMTIQPSKTFFLNGSREQSPNPGNMMNSQASSPAAFFNNHSPLSGNGDLINNGFGQNTAFDPSSLSFAPISSISLSNSLSPSNSAHQGPGAKWPCLLTVDPTPEKSRVETQIPIKLTLHDVPAGITKIHLPAHTISKPKFQAKPPFVKSEDTLELYTMLVCASALQKDGLEKRAFNLAAMDEEGSIDDPSGASLDENDPSKPLNGGPVSICQGCIVRERKRAARKKTKKVDEEEEWAKDEAKRVVVFNCAEVRDWCVPGTKETAVKDHDGPLDAMFVHAPMRIACYCRHQSEKVGFQVIFTIKTSGGTILAQAISNSIMITDDHKQPVSHAGPAAPLPFAAAPSQVPGSGVFTPGQPYGLYPSFSQDMPFRPSWSTNDLRLLGNQYAPQPQQFQRHYAQTDRSQHSTASATPRNLSRPASPTSPSGHSTKKRRSAGSASGKVPAGLTMTRIETKSPPINTNGALSGIAPTSSTGFTFASPTMNAFGSPMEQPFQPHPIRRSSHLQSGPPTPLGGTGMITPNGPFGSPPTEADPYPFFSAPTSQHPSRAPSPTSVTRMSSGNYQSQHVPQQAAYALDNLPPGINLQRPPIIQRLIPNTGPRSGGDEVTVLGSGFFQGLDVMFGDNTATNTTFWGDTTLVCRAPPSATTGTVAVVFKHQHHTNPRVIQALLPTRLVAYNYYDDDKKQMQGLALGVTSQLQNMNGGQMSQEDLARNFFPNQPRVSKFNRTNSSGRVSQRHHAFTENPEEMTDADFEVSLMHWLESLDMADGPFEPRFNLRNANGSTLLILASGRGYNRFTAGLLARGVNPDMRNRSGFTALMMASLHGHPTIARRLLLKGADAGVRSLRGQTASDVAATREVSDLLTQIDFLSNRLQKSVNITRRYRRPSSVLSVESLSGVSASSQPSHPDADETSTISSSEHPGEPLIKVWSNKQVEIPSQTSVDWHSIQECPALLNAGTALVAWREQIASQIHQFHHAMVHNMHNLQFPDISPASYLQMPVLSMPDYRRLTELIMTPAASALPPAYNDIYPGELVPRKEGCLVVKDQSDGKFNCVEVLDAAVLESSASTVTALATTSRISKSVAVKTGFLRSILSFPWTYVQVLLLLGLVLGWATSGFADLAISKSPLSLVVRLQGQAALAMQAA